MKHLLLFTSVCLLLFAMGCGTKEKLDRTLDNANSTVEQVNLMLMNLNKAVSQVGDAEKSAANAFNPAQSARVSVPSAVVPNATREVDGQTGTVMEDIDGDGVSDTIEFLETENQFYFWWEDGAYCFLGWVEGETNNVAFNGCGLPGAYICDLDGETQTCRACNDEGVCLVCLAGQDCDIPGTGGDTDSGMGPGCNQEAADYIVGFWVECTGEPITSEQICATGVSDVQLQQCADAFEVVGCQAVTDPACA